MPCLNPKIHLSGIAYVTKGIGFFLSFFFIYIDCLDDLHNIVIIPSWKAFLLKLLCFCCNCTQKGFRVLNVFV